MPRINPPLRVLAVDPTSVVADERRAALDSAVIDAWSALDIPVAVFDLVGGELEWAAANPAMERALGVPFEVLQGCALDGTSERPLDAWMLARLPALTSLRARATYEPERSEAERWITRTITPVRDEHDELLRLVVVSMDVTEQHRVAALLTQATRMDAIGRVAGDAAREFNNLMVAISGYAGLVQRSLPPEGRAQEHMAEVLRLTDAASALTRQLLAFAKRQEGTASLVHLDELALGLERVLSRFLREGITLELRRTPGLWLVKVDPQQMEQVLLHLASHAREAMPRGGTLALEAANVTLTREEAHSLGVGPGEHVLFTMTDTGAGLEAPAMQAMFDSQPGVGRRRSDAEVGVATCYGIVRRHGGAITVASAPNHGTTFRVHLPRALEKSVVSGVSVASARLKGSETVLVVDPGTARDASARTLRMLGYTVFDAATAEEALRVVGEDERATIHLVVLGVAPASPSAMALLRAVKSRDGDVPVLVTAKDAASVMPVALLSSRVVTLAESLAPTGLARKVREALDEKR